ncbi:RecD-like DNA helicase [Burkholderia phage BCSR5]|nr:RecD-like DNA helicase [Burkholderia phage BCSR5]
MTLPKLRGQQVEAFNKIVKWLRGWDVKGKKRSTQVFKLFGYAGTGKTTMASVVSDFVQNEYRGAMLFAAYTGKAAKVLRLKGCDDASTIHRLIYKPIIDEATGLFVGKTINRESPLATARLLILDEVSQVNEEIRADLESFGVQILVLGDPFQLKPVEGTGAFTAEHPDYLLTEIHRQAKDSPIIWLATEIREGRRLKPGKYGDSRVFSHYVDLKDARLAWADQVIVGRNKTRDELNQHIRAMKGATEIIPSRNGGLDPLFYPVIGDKLMCTRNNHDAGFMNGTIWFVTDVPIKQKHQIINPKYSAFLKQHKFPPSHIPKFIMSKEEILSIPVRPEEDVEWLGFKGTRKALRKSDSSKDLVTVVPPYLFNDRLPEPNYRDIAGSDSWCFGDTITCHKAQGSQWDKVLVIDESYYFRDQVAEHLYTSITRAAEIVVVKQT